MRNSPWPSSVALAYGGLPAPIPTCRLVTEAGKRGPNGKVMDHKDAPASTGQSQGMYCPQGDHCRTDGAMRPKGWALSHDRGHLSVLSH